VATTLTSPCVIPAHKVSWSFFCRSGGLMTHLAPSKSLSYKLASKQQILDTGFDKDFLIAAGRIPHRIEGAFTGEVYDITGTAGVVGYVGKPARGLSLSDFGLGQIVIQRGELPSARCLAMR